MEKKFLIVNIGSASKKYAIFENGRELLHWHFEYITERHIVTMRGADGKEEARDVSPVEYRESVSFVLKQAQTRGMVKDENEIAALGVRIVAPGSFFTEHRKVNDAFISRLREAKREAPLHVAPVLSELEIVEKILPSLFSSGEIIGISDSAFHQTMPRKARLYGLPREDAKRLDIYRFGYHGISTQSIVRTLGKMSGTLPSRCIVCHLGGGVSITAVKDGKSTETSMGFTPLEGVPMSTRVGSIDVGAALYLAKNHPDGTDALYDYFNHESGLMGVSGLSGDIRALLVAEEKGNEDARDALELFVYHIQKHIGISLAVLGGVDLLVFSGTIGERSRIMRSRITDGLQSLGIVIDHARNKEMISKDGFINTETSPVKIAVIVSREMEEMAIEMNTYLASR